MARISTYPIISTPTLNDLLIGTDVDNLNNTKNFTISEIGDLIGQDYVPYVGATGNVNLGAFNIQAAAFIVPGGLANQFLKANGTLDSTAYVPETRTITINGTTFNLSANRTWDLPTIDSLTTIGTSGAATYIGKVLNIPIYQPQGNYITQLSGEATALGPGNATVTLDNTAVISKVLSGLNITGGNIIASDNILQAFGKVQNQINSLVGGVQYQGTWNADTNTPTLQSSVGVKGYYYVVSVPGSTNLNGITDWKLGDWAIYNGTAWDKVDNTDAVVSVNGYTGAVVLTFSDVGAPPATRTLTINGVGYDLSADRSWTVGDVRTDGSYANPSWITSLGWNKITSTPTTLAGYGITDGASNTTTLTINGVTFDLSANRTWNVGTVTSIATSGPLTGGTITTSGTIGITQAGPTTDGYLSSADWNDFNDKLDSLSASAPITLAAGVIGITQSGASSNGFLSSTDWNTFNNKQNALTNPVTGTGTTYTLPMWSGATTLTDSPLSYVADAFTFLYNSNSGGTVNFTNIGLTAYTYSIQMNNFGSPKSTVHSYTDGIIVNSIAGTQVSRMFANGNFILGDGFVDNGYKLEVEGNVYIETIANATVDTDRFLVSDGGVVKYRTGSEVLSDIGAVPSTRTLTINGTAYDLSADRSWSVGTVTSVDMSVPTGFTISGNPVTGAGTLAVAFASGYSLPTNASQANWTTAYNDSIVSAAVTGVETKTLTLNQQDGGTITATWSDYDTAPVTSVFGRTGAIIAQSGDYSTTLVTEGTNLYYTDGRARLAISLTTTGSSGPATYSNITGVFNIPDYGTALVNYVPYSGATQSVNLGEFGLTAGFVGFDLTPTGTPSVPGTMFWSVDDETVDLVMDAGVTQKIGQETFYLVKNQTGAPIPKGTVVRADGTVGASGRILIAPFLANGTVPSKFCIGVTAETIANGADGFVTAFGKIRQINTASFPNGTVLYASPTSAGGFTATPPQAPNNIVTVAIVVNSNTTNGAIFVRPTFSSNINEDEGVKITTPVANEGLFYNGGYWVNKTIAAALGYTPANSATTLTINGQAYDLSANRAWSVGTVTSVDMSVPIGFGIAGNPITGAGTLALTFAAGYSLPTNASQANWDTAYSNRITSLTTTGTSGAASLISNVLNIPQYQAQGNYITSLTGEATASGPGAASVTLTNSAVTGKVLTGLTVAGSSIASTDSILTAFGKLQGQVNDLIGGLQYQGTWDASTNTPNITSGVGTDGHFYIVSVAGNTTIDGVSGWQVGDWIVFHAPVWQKVDNTESVVSVNGFTGAVTLTTTNISEGTNLYFTDSRARTAISLTTTGNSGASTYNNGTGVLNVPQYSLAGLGGVPTTRSLTINGTAFDLSADRTWSVGTVTSIATTGPIQGGTITGTGTISITQAGSASDGFLSSTDWNTFNNKQGTISLTTTGNSGSSTFISNVLNVPTYTLAGLGGVPTTRTLSINGVSFDLSADRSWSVGTLTGSGNTSYIPKWNGSTSLTDSLLFDNGSGLGLGTASINASALFQMDSTTRGFLPPRMTAAQRGAISAPAQGLIVYQTDGVIGLYIYANSVWRTLGMI
jgi:predicted heme/steroid binding protein